MPLTKTPRGSEPVFVDELIMEILSWVPVKFLLRLRCLCKSWKSLFSHPHFLKLHLHKSLKTPNLILTLYSKSNPQPRIVTYSQRSLLESPTLAFNPQDAHLLANNNYKVLGSCNGLVCLFQEGKVGEYWFKLCNPATRLESPKWFCLRTAIFGFTKLGFGYDKSSDTYKVVAVLKDSTRTQVKVHTVGDRCYWRDIQRFPAVPIQFGNEGIFLSGTLNWLAIRNVASSDYNWFTLTIDQLVIVSLDLGKETYKQLLLPVGLDEIPHWPPTIGAFGNRLCLFHDYKRTHFVVWQMKEFGVEKSWTQLAKVRYQRLQIGEPIQFLSLVPLCISENGDFVMQLSNSFKVILYNRRNNRVERAAEFPNDKVSIDAKDYVQSLILPC